MGQIIFATFSEPLLFKGSCFFNSYARAFLEDSVF